jgi:hypothetical protein
MTATSTPRLLTRDASNVTCAMMTTAHASARKCAIESSTNKQPLIVPRTDKTEEIKRRSSSSAASKVRSSTLSTTRGNVAWIESQLARDTSDSMYMNSSDSSFLTVDDDQSGEYEIDFPAAGHKTHADSTTKQGMPKKIQTTICPSKDAAARTNINFTASLVFAAKERRRFVTSRKSRAVSAKPYVSWLPEPGLLHGQKLHEKELEKGDRKVGNDIVAKKKARGLCTEKEGDLVYAKFYNNVRKGSIIALSSLRIL